MQTTSWYSKILGILALLVVGSAAGARAAESPTAIAAQAVNALGLDLFRQTAKPDANALLSPYSIQSAMAMAYAGADGVTREEMARVLHYPNDDSRTHHSFAELRRALAKAVSEREREIADLKRYMPDAKNDPISLSVANRLFGQTGYDFRPPFLALLKAEYAAPFVPVEFVHNAPAATKQINDWIEEQTKGRIREPMPSGALNERTRLVVVNAIYLKAGWIKPFDASATKAAPFFVNGRARADVPTMHLSEELGYATGSGYSAVSLYYAGFKLRFLIFLPDKAEGLASLEQKLNADALAGKLNWDLRAVTLQLPKFKLDPPFLSLAAVLEPLGMKSAFDHLRGSANFDRMVPRRSEDHLALSAVFHKAFLNLDEQGTEAAAATAIEAAVFGIHEPKQPVLFKVDHPFLFLIQHLESGACLFLGHVVYPR